MVSGPDLYMKKGGSRIMKPMVLNCSVLHDGAFVQDTVCISGGVFVSGGSIAVSDAVDVSSCVLLPGFADVHVHLRA